MAQISKSGASAPLNTAGSERIIAEVSSSSLSRGSQIRIQGTSNGTPVGDSPVPTRLVLEKDQLEGPVVLSIRLRNKQRFPLNSMVMLRVFAEANAAGGITMSNLFVDGALDADIAKLELDGSTIDVTRMVENSHERQDPTSVGMRPGEEATRQESAIHESSSARRARGPLHSLAGQAFNQVDPQTQEALQGWTVVQDNSASAKSMSAEISTLATLLSLLTKGTTIYGPAEKDGDNWVGPLEVQGERQIVVTDLPLRLSPSQRQIAVVDPDVSDFFNSEDVFCVTREEARLIAGLSDTDTEGIEKSRAVLSRLVQYITK